MQHHKTDEATRNLREQLKLKKWAVKVCKRIGYPFHTHTPLNHTHKRARQLQACHVTRRIASRDTTWQRALIEHHGELNWAAS